MIQFVYYAVSLNIPSSVKCCLFLCRVSLTAFVLSVPTGCWFRTAGAHRRRPHRQHRAGLVERSKHTAC